jgi:hypothetical protein
MLKVLPAFTVRVAVPLRVREPVRFKSMFSNGDPVEIVIISVPDGTIPLHQLEALFQSFEIFPFQFADIVMTALPLKFEIELALASVIETNV